MIDYLAPYKLLKEAREAWQYVFSDEVVYAFQHGDIIIGRGQGGYLDSYLKGYGWIEFFCYPVFVCPGHSYAWVAIMERDMNFCWPFDDSPRSTLRLNDEAVLSAVGDFSQDGQEMCFRSIRTVIRLKVFDVGDSRWEDIRKLPRQLIQKSSSCVPWTIANRKLRVDVGIMGSSQMFDSQLPCDVVDTSSQAIRNITNNSPPRIGNKGRPIEVNFPIALLGGHSQWVILIPRNPSFQGIEASFRPSTLESSMIQRMGNWNHE